MFDHEESIQTAHPHGCLFVWDSRPLIISSASLGDTRRCRPTTATPPRAPSITEPHLTLRGGWRPSRLQDLCFLERRLRPVLIWVQSESHSECSQQEEINPEHFLTHQMLGHALHSVLSQHLPRRHSGVSMTVLSWQRWGDQLSRHSRDTVGRDLNLESTSASTVLPTVK